jgi:hypothetical protein
MLTTTSSKIAIALLVFTMILWAAGALSGLHAPQFHLLLKGLAQ